MPKMCHICTVGECCSAAQWMHAELYIWQCCVVHAVAQTQSSTLLFSRM